MTPEGPSGGSGGSRRQRVILSIFFVVHWGAVFTYVLPQERESLDLLPGWARAVALWTIPRAVNNAWPVAKPYLDITATRQTWTLFAPWPANWKSSIRVVPYFPVPGSDALWVADTVVLQGSVERPYPHILGHRTYRILYNMGYDDWGVGYRPHFARELCRSLRTTDGRAPDGLSLLAVWWPLTPPWEGTPGDRYDQFLGGFDCEADERANARAPWKRYGLPAALDASGWPEVAARDTTAAEARPGGEGG